MLLAFLRMPTQTLVYFKKFNQSYLFGDRKNPVRDSSYLVHFEFFQKWGKTEDKKGQKEGFEGAMPREGTVW